MVKIQFIFFFIYFFLQANQMHFNVCLCAFFLEVFISTPLFLFRIVGKNALWQGWCNVSKKAGKFRKMLITHVLPSTATYCTILYYEYDMHFCILTYEVWSCVIDGGMENV